MDEAITWLALRRIQPQRWSALAFALAGALIAVPAVAAPTDGWGDDSSDKPDAKEEATEAKREPAPLQGEDLRQMVPDLRIDPSPYPYWITVGFGGRYPFQAIALGLGLDVYATPWLRMNLTYAAGVTAVRDGREVGFAFSQYAEGSVGLAAIRGSDTATVELPMKDPFSEKPGRLKAVIPSYFGVFLEGGAMTGLLAPSRCVSQCVPPADPTLVTDTMQLVYPFAGIRYVAFHGVSSERTNFKSHDIFQAFFHLIGRPVNVRDRDLVGLVGDDMKPIYATDLGFRFGIESPHICREASKACIRLGVTLGLSPLPKGGAMFEVQMSN
jgi:hypothetical protein